MKNFAKLLLLSVLLLPSVGFGQTAKILPQVVKEGSTAYVSVVFYDENNQTVTPKEVWFRVNDYPSGTALQATQSCISGTCTTGAYFSPTSPAGSMNLTIYPCGNRILNEGSAGPERTGVAVWFAYPSSCSLTTVGDCKWGSGEAIFDRDNVKNMLVCAGSTGTVLTGVNCTNGCPFSGTTCGANTCP